MYNTIYKRFIDLILSFLGLIVVSPLIIFMILMLLIHNRGTAFFVQPRPGKKGKIFKLIKFKTMNDRIDDQGNLLPDSMRLTKTGKFIRSTSLDELPQLINVLKGDMSLVGPRPLLVKYLPLYNPQQARRHEVKPGITGWTQVNGRNSVGWDDKFDLDIWYIDNLSFKIDVKILWMTVIKVFNREGINATDATTMKPFTGNNQ